MGMVFECDMCPARDTSENAGGFPIIVANRIIAAVCTDCVKRAPELITALMAETKRKTGAVLDRAMSGMPKAPEPVKVDVFDLRAADKPITAQFLGIVKDEVDPTADTEKPKE